MNHKVTAFYIFFKYGQIQDEKLCVGIIYFIDDSKESHIFISKNMLKLTRKINNHINHKGVFELFKNSVNTLAKSKKYCTPAYLERQVNYANGITKFEGPHTFNIEKAPEEFMQFYFNKYIDRK